MKKHTVTTYSFAELSAKAKAKAIDQFRDVNTDYEWWESTYEFFGEFCDILGVDVDQKMIFFNGFYTQGSGATFDANINVPKLIEAIKNKAWQTEYPTVSEKYNFTPALISIDKRVLKLIEADTIDVDARIKHNDRPYSSNLSYDTNYYFNKCNSYDNIDRELSKLEDWLEEIVEELDSLLFKVLENEYEYRTSDEAVIESIEANEYEFLESGTQY
jgi:hypothetical protein